MIDTTNYNDGKRGGKVRVRARIEESDKKGGKIVKISRWDVGPDGKTMHVRFDNTQGFVQEQTGHKVQ
jgi:hypothetical protein